MGSWRTYGREVDYLGSLSRILKDLTGFATLAHELIQNADDAEDTTEIVFDIRRGALVVRNDGVFTNCRQLHLHPDACPLRSSSGHRCDFHSFRSVSSGDKRERADTTGAFGIGFTAVYQITDRPELMSAGVHWVLDETAPGDARIRECPGCEACRDVPGTVFILPWADDPESDFRQVTASVAVDPSAVAGDLRQTLERVAPSAVLFLRRVRTIAIEVDGHRVRTVTCERDGDLLLVTDGDGQNLWRVFDGQFRRAAEELRARYPGKIEEVRRETVSVAVPDEAGASGIFCAYLPTEEGTGLPFHVNGDYFVNSERRHLSTDGFQGEWNRLVTDCAAQTLADNLVALRDFLSPSALWASMQSAWQAARAGGESWSTAFWPPMAAALRDVEAAHLSTEAWGPLDGALLLKEQDEEVALLPAFEALGLHIVHADIRSHCYGMRWREDLGLAELGLGHLVDALLDAGFGVVGARQDLPAPFCREGGMELLFAELDRLILRSVKDAQRSMDDLAALCIAEATDGLMYPLGETYRTDTETEDLLRRLDVHAPLLAGRDLSGSFPRVFDLCPRLGAEAMVALLEGSDQEALVEVQRAEPALTRDLLVWFRRREPEIVGSDTLTNRLTLLPVFPGQVGPCALVDLSLPGDFVDEAGSAELVDMDAAEGLGDFLTALGARTLTFETYLVQWLPGAVETLRADGGTRWRRLVDQIAVHQSSLRSATGVRDVLVTLPLVETTTGSFVRPAQAYLPTPDVVDVFADTVPIASLVGVEGTPLEGLLTWLGVDGRPRDADLLARVDGVVGSPPTPEGRRAVAAIVTYLVRLLAAGSWPTGLDRLRIAAWLPAVDDAARWFAPPELFATYQHHLFASQAHFVDLPYSLERAANEVLGTLGVGLSAPVPMIVRHLLYCADSGTPLTDSAIYRRLADETDDPSVVSLRGTVCIHVADGVYVRPEHVFFGPHPFGSRRRSLSPEWQASSRLLHFIGVRDVPDHEDAISVLRELADELGSSNAPVDGESALVHGQCWTLIEDSLIDGVVDATSVRDALAGVKCVRDRRGILLPPDLVLFDDLPGIADHLAGVGENLVRRPDRGWKAMRAAGVRDLSRAVEARVVELEGERDADELRRRLQDRFSQLVRIFHPVTDRAPERARELLTRVRLSAVTTIQIQYVLPCFRVTGDIHDVDALYNEGDERLYAVCRAGSYPWLSVARELVRALGDDLVPGSHSAAIALVLSSASADEADRALDDTGLARVDAVELTAIATEQVHWLMEAEHDDAPPSHSQSERGNGHTGAGVAAPGSPAFAGQAPAQGTTSGSTGGGSAEASVGPGSKNGEASAGPANRAPGTGTTGETGAERPTPGQDGVRTGTGSRDRLRSYVLPEGEEDSEAGAASEDIRVIDGAGVAAVLAYEREAGREPRLMGHSHPGYDVESTDAERSTIRYIEVKSLRGDWRGYGVGLTPTQFECARRIRTDYWLYVVEGALQPTPRIHVFRDPTSKIGQYRFDDGWLAVADLEQDDARDDATLTLDLGA